MIVGTAGHVDHGKTALIRALTGVATDRLKEEQVRGLTIEAGYAYPEPPPEYAGATLGFIDVPGHERFIANMLSGAVGIQAMLLVVAADDGIMPQTREHARILELLGVTQAWVALTKVDRVDPDRIAQVMLELQCWLADTAFAEAPIFPLSNASGEGIGALGHALWTAAAHVAEGVATAPPDSGRFRLAIDRVFTKRGAGIVVTGTVRSGRVALGDSVRLLPTGLAARVRGLRCQDRDAKTASRGERCAINLSGADIETGCLDRGDWVVAEASRLENRLRLDVVLRLLPASPPLKHWTSVHLHHGSAHVTGRVSLLEAEVLAPGTSMLAQLVLDSPLQAAHGDRVVIRDRGASDTLGGARVLDTAPPRRGARKPRRLAWLNQLREMLPDERGVQDLRVLWRRTALDDGIVDLTALAANLDRDSRELESSASLAGWWVITHQGVSYALPEETHRHLYRQAQERLALIHEQEPAMRGVDIDRLRRMVAPQLAAGLFRPLLERWKAGNEIVQHGPFVALASHEATLSPDEALRWQKVKPLLQASPYDPPRVRDIAQQFEWPEGDVRRLLRSCALLGSVYQLRQDHFFLTSHVAELAGMIRELDAIAPAGATAADFRDRIGGGRKLAVAILEFFDRIGFTRRIGDGHRVIRDDMLFD
ncbi:selenocysteine-specific translation elongation factor [Salinicola socius]|uniref:Selenocysteine-specific translation elongation factor n=1 Tax=Salinicola socius TaxID=404433 RepID=A0A1Q8SRP4_9GAMM|nr:selenocysteine-specific translation elongation factor [Salinicola socius]OLO04098.1 selenocysteine-specific translation elongation factor [Salinicola socius]